MSVLHAYLLNRVFICSNVIANQRFILPEEA